MAQELACIPLEALGNIPSAAPPPGKQPNFVSSPDKAPAFYAVASIFLGLATGLFGVRLYVNRFIVRKNAWDDCELVEHSFWKSLMHCQIC